MAGILRQVFMGTNTPRGFYDMSGDITGGARYLYLFKGGPGVGKSSFMRRVGDRLMEAGLDIEYFLCGSDPKSLDALHIPSLRVALMDATSPHERDARLPGVADEIVALGAHWDARVLRAQRERIQKLFDAIAAKFAMGGRYLQACAPLMREMRACHSADEDWARRSKDTDTLMENVTRFAAAAPRGGRRHFMVSAISGRGFVNHMESLEARTHRVVLSAPFTCAWSSALAEAAVALSASGAEAVMYRDPLSPDHIAHIDIPGADAAVITDCPLTPVKLRAGDVVLGETAPVAPVAPAASDMAGAGFTRAREHVEALLARAEAALREGMELHDELEAIYVSAMDFSRNQRLADAIAEEILGYWANVT